jgi:hypothetical protein
MALHPTAPASEPGIYDRERGGGTYGNRLLTAQTGAVLIVLLAVIGVTILRMGQLVSVHMFVGMMLIPIVLLKMGSTGYRFARYYTFDTGYRRAGPPAPLLRIIAPMVLLSTMAVFVTGVVLMIEGPNGRGTLSELHKLSFFVWIAFAAPHVIGHLGEIPGAISRRYSGALSGLTTEIESFPGMRRVAPVEESPEWDAHGTGQAGRLLSLAGALIAGLVLALTSLTWFGPWLHQLPFVGH